LINANIWHVFNRDFRHSPPCFCKSDAFFHQTVKIFLHKKYFFAHKKIAVDLMFSAIAYLRAVTVRYAHGRGFETYFFEECCSLLEGRRTAVYDGVRDSKHKPSAAVVGHSAEIFGRFLNILAVLGFFELAMVAFG